MYNSDNFHNLAIKQCHINTLAGRLSRHFGPKHDPTCPIAQTGIHVPDKKDVGGGVGKGLAFFSNSAGHIPAIYGSHMLYHI